MLKIDNTLIEELGLTHLTDEQQKEVLARIAVIADMRIGQVLARELEGDQLEEFRKLNESDGDESEMEEWMSKNFPNYQEIFTKEFEDMKNEFSEQLKSADSILNGQTSGADKLFNQTLSDTQGIEIEPEQVE
jgi:hypothetical protein